MAAGRPRQARRAILLAAALLVALGPRPAPAANPFVPVAVTARPIEHFALAGDAAHFGELDYRGGIELLSRNRDFGSWSGLDLDDSGTALIAVADTGFWLTARLVEDSAGRLTGLRAPRMARMLDSSGRPMRRKRDSDAESVRLVDRNGPAALVMFEQSNMLRLYRGPVERLPESPATTVAVPAEVAALRGNRGVETVAVAPAQSPLNGATVLIAERALDPAGNHRGFILGGPLGGTFAVRRIGSYDITDADFLPNGDLVILERRFNLAAGVGMRIRRLAARDLRPGGTVDGPVLVEAGTMSQIDNMEGLALRPRPDGGADLFVLSDDNGSPLQRTLLLKFSWTPPPATN